MALTVKQVPFSFVLYCKSFYYGRGITALNLTYFIPLSFSAAEYRFAFAMCSA